MKWWLFVRLVVDGHARGRVEVECKACGGFFWLYAHELGSWPGCPHCLGWWTFAR